MKKVLAVEYPIITSYTHHAHLLTILGTNEKTKDWIFSNYIQVYINKDFEKSNWADFYFPMPYEIKPVEICKWMQTQKNQEEFIDKSYEDIVRYIIDAIDSDFYIHMMINYRYVSSSRFSTENVDRRHDVLVYGYDSDRQVLNCADFTFETSKYAFSECSYDEFRRAYYNDCLRNEPSYLDHSINAYRLRDSCTYQLDTGNIIYALKQYVNGWTPEYWNAYNYKNKKDILWGIDYYDGLKYNLRNEDRDWIDVRFIYLLLDHKKMMQERIKFIRNYLLNADKFIEEYEDIYRNLTIVMNYVIKFNIHKNEKAKEKIIIKLSEIKEKEYKTISAMIEELESYGVRGDNE